MLLYVLSKKNPVVYGKGRGGASFIPTGQRHASHAGDGRFWEMFGSRREHERLVGNKNRSRRGYHFWQRQNQRPNTRPNQQQWWFCATNSISNQGPQNMFALNFLQYSDNALLRTCLYDPFHREWNDIKRACKRANLLPVENHTGAYSAL